VPRERFSRSSPGDDRSSDFRDGMHPKVLASTLHLVFA
jgi:hypothetical protein